MIGWLKNLFKGRSSKQPSPEPAPLRQTGAHTRPRPAPSTREKTRPANASVESVEGLSGTIESLGPGKNVLVRSKYVREETGTHDTLRILDDSLVENDDEDGIDPYNTGAFDRSKNWDTRFR